MRRRRVPTKLRDVLGYPGPDSCTAAGGGSLGLPYCYYSHYLMGSDLTETAAFDPVAADAASVSGEAFSIDTLSLTEHGQPEPNKSSSVWIGSPAGSQSGASHSPACLLSRQACTPEDARLTEAPSLYRMRLLGITTALHFDVQDNFYAQIRGEKQFVVADPSQHRLAKLFPRVRF